jgi:UDP-glucose 4-epimerase
MQKNSNPILVTGCNGFIGKELSNYLISKGLKVIGVGRGISNIKNLNFLHFDVDLNNSIEISNICSNYQPSTIIHLAGGKPPSVSLENEQFTEYFHTNQVCSWNVIRAALQVPNLSRFVFLGSCEEYGEIDVPYHEFSRELPNTPYGLSKLGISQFLKALSRTRHFPIVILRPSVIYGPGQKKSMFLPSLLNHLFGGQIFPMSDGSQTRDYIFIDDVIDAIYLSIILPNIYGEIINVSSNTPILIKDLVAEVLALIKPSIKAEISYGAINYRIGEAINYYASNLKAKALLGWEPRTSLSIGLKNTIDWYESNSNFYCQE